MNQKPMNGSSAAWSDIDRQSYVAQVAARERAKVIKTLDQVRNTLLECSNLLLILETQGTTNPPAVTSYIVQEALDVQTKLITAIQRLEKLRSL